MPRHHVGSLGGGGAVPLGADRSPTRAPLLFSAPGHEASAALPPASMTPPGLL